MWLVRARKLNRQVALKDVSSRHTVLPMKTVSGSIWMLDSVDR